MWNSGTGRRNAPWDPCSPTAGAPGPMREEKGVLGEMRPSSPGEGSQSKGPRCSPRARHRSRAKVRKFGVLHHGLVAVRLTPTPAWSVYSTVCVGASPSS